MNSRKRRITIDRESGGLPASWKLHDNRETNNSEIYTERQIEEITYPCLLLSWVPSCGDGRLCCLWEKFSRNRKRLRSISSIFTALVSAMSAASQAAIGNRRQGWAVLERWELWSDGGMCPWLQTLQRHQEMEEFMAAWSTMRKRHDSEVDSSNVVFISQTQNLKCATIHGVFIQIGFQTPQKRQEEKECVEQSAMWKHHNSGQIQGTVCFYHKIKGWMCHKLWYIENE